jgi:hypothetical protein
MSQDSSHEAQLSRPSTIGPFGKLDAEAKTVVDTDTLEAFDKKARGAGSTRSDLLRNLIYLCVHQKSYDALMADAADRRMRLLLGEGLELAADMQALTVRGEVGGLPREVRA